MNRTAAFALATMLTLAGGGGCGGDDEEDSSPAAKPSTTPTKPTGEKQRALAEERCSKASPAKLGRKYNAPSDDPEVVADAYAATTPPRFYADAREGCLAGFRAAKPAPRARAATTPKPTPPAEPAAPSAKTPPPEAPAESSSCHPDYGGCLDANASDYDCEGGSGDGPKYTSTVESKGSDPFDLDRDDNGIGCD